MGDMADMALEHACEEQAIADRYRFSPAHIQYEQGLIDEHGCQIGHPGSLPVASVYTGRWKAVNPTSSPDCPQCGSSMIAKMGVYGGFLGCTAFPRCKGSRSIK